MTIMLLFFLLLDNEEKLQRAEEPDGSTLTSLEKNSEDKDEDVSSHVESDTGDSDYREESSRGQSVLTG